MRCQQGTKFGWIPLGSVFIKERKNAGQMFVGHSCNKPPLTIIYVGNGCEAYSSNLYIPAILELTSRDDTVVRHNYFQQFNEKYQNLTKYSLIEDLGIEKLKRK